MKNNSKIVEEVFDSIVSESGLRGVIDKATDLGKEIGKLIQDEVKGLTELNLRKITKPTQAKTELSREPSNKDSEIRKKFFDQHCIFHPGDSGPGGGDPQEPVAYVESLPSEVWQWFEQQLTEAREEAKNDLHMKLVRLDWIKVLDEAIRSRPTSWGKDPVREWRNAGDTIWGAVVKHLGLGIYSENFKRKCLIIRKKIQDGKD